jgi:hypothetical protein
MWIRKGVYVLILAPHAEMLTSRPRSSLIIIHFFHCCGKYSSFQVELISAWISEWTSLTQVARCSVVGWGTRLQAGRSRVWFPMRSQDFFNSPKPSSRIMAPRLTQGLTVMSTGKRPRGKGRQTLKVDDLTIICGPTVYKTWEPWRLTTL